MRLALGVSYRGAAYQGWQSQPGGQTVQDRAGIRHELWHLMLTQRSAKKLFLIKLALKFFDRVIQLLFIHNLHQ